MIDEPREFIQGSSRDLESVVTPGIDLRVVRALINGREGVAITTSYDNALLLFNLLTSQAALQVGSAPFA